LSLDVLIQIEIARRPRQSASYFPRSSSEKTKCKDKDGEAMNAKGRRTNLVASHPENRNAEKAGVFSPRRRAEAAAEVKAGLAQDPAGYLSADLVELYAMSRGIVELVERDLHENGVSDRHGKERRQVSMFASHLKKCLEIQDRVRIAVGVSEGDDSYRQDAWSEGEGLDILRSFAHDPAVSDSTRFASIRFLLERKGSVVDRPFSADLDAMSDEEIAFQLRYWEEQTSGEADHTSRTA
jgi:hypothetical protein